MRRSFMAVVLLAALLVVLPQAAHAQNRKRGDRYRITTDEIAEAAATVNTAYDAIPHAPAAVAEYAPSPKGFVKLGRHERWRN